ncbi:hypothetical protein [Leptospira fainei]|uniref:hypothetical protein n=1 Tax=Leptospira fainei TaxID=48782 RepID=UPI000587CFC8|nr:hypothetical protein [Leptospira fainei]
MFQDVQPFLGGGRSEAVELPYFTKIERLQFFFILQFVWEFQQISSRIRSKLCKKGQESETYTPIWQVELEGPIILA